MPRFINLSKALFLSGIVILAGCATGGQQDLPEVSDDGLTLVHGTKADAVYKDPNANFGQFDRLYIAEVRVAFRKDWLKDQNQGRRSVSRRLTQEDADRIKDAVAREFERIFAEELTEGGYLVFDSGDTTSADEDLLLLRPAIVNLDVSAPDTQSPGRTRTYTASAASMSLYMEFYDSITGALLGRVMDSQAARDNGYMQITNSVTNKAEADRMLRKWARLLVDRLDKVHGR